MSNFGFVLSFQILLNYFFFSSKDQFDNVAKYTEKSLQFCEKYESFLKDRCTVEDDYAKALKKLTKTYTPKLKEQEEFCNK